MTAASSQESGCLLMPQWAGHRYKATLRRLGITVHLGQLRWSTSLLNHVLQRRRRGARTWFSLGAAASLLLLPAAVVLLLHTVYWLLLPVSSGQAQSAPLLQPVVPGVNLPAGEIPSYLLALLLCSAFHEFAHGAAAAGERVKVLGSGVFILLGIPAAFVELDTDELLSLPPWPRLRVLCAGVWHNVVLSAVALGLLLAAPTLWSPLYSTGGGVYVYSVPQGSPLGGAAGLVTSDVITAVGSCPVSVRRDWVRCLSMGSKRGVCVSDDDISALDETIEHPEVGDDGLVQCCSASSASTRLCFLYAEDPGRLSCLPARALMQPSPPRCDSNSDCSDANQLCLNPSLPDNDRLLTFHRRDGKVVVFVGTPAVAYSSASVSDYYPRLPPLPASLPLQFSTLLRHITTLSAALAMLNLIPVRGLDGGWICAALLELVGGRRVAGRWTNVCTTAGTVLMIAAAVLSVRYALS